MTEPWVRFDDDELLVVAKPAGVNTHRADAHAQDGMYEWVARQSPGVALSVLHRLDKDTSGLLVFGKTPAANRALAAQFEARTVTKRYVLLADAGRREGSYRATGDVGGQQARTDFDRRGTGDGARIDAFDARPHTGRTHQIRIHAQALGMPVIGDTRYGGRDAARLFLHAAELSFTHPNDDELTLSDPMPAAFDLVLDGADPASATVAAQAAAEARTTLFDPADTDAYLWIDRHHDGFAGIRVERLGEVALVLNYGDAPLPPAWLDAVAAGDGVRSVYEQRRPRGGGGGPATLVRGNTPAQFPVRELGCTYLIDLEASATSSGLFLDQRETRRELLSMELSGRTVLNVFAHTGALSVAAARAGAETLTLDLSKRYLAWADENLRANDIDPAAHDRIYGDALDWMTRLAKKGRTFDVVLIDPPSTSTTKGSKRWVAERDLHDVVARGARLCAPEGMVYVSTNLHRLGWPAFLDHLERGLAAAGRSGTIDTRTLPLDHRSGPGDPPYLKAAWISL